MIVLPTISHAQTLKGGYWKAHPKGVSNMEDWKMAIHWDTLGGAFVLSCNPKTQQMVFTWSAFNKKYKHEPDKRRSADIIIDGKSVLSSKSFFTTTVKTGYAPLNLRININRQIDLIEKFRTAQRTIGIKLQDGYLYTVNAKGSTKSAAVFKACLTPIKTWIKKSNATINEVKKTILHKNSQSQYITKEKGVWEYFSQENTPIEIQAYAVQYISNKKYMRINCIKDTAGLSITLNDKYDLGDAIWATITNYADFKMDDNYRFNTTVRTTTQRPNIRTTKMEFTTEKAFHFLLSLEKSAENISFILDDERTFVAKSRGDLDVALKLKGCIERQLK